MSTLPDFSGLREFAVDALPSPPSPVVLVGSQTRYRGPASVLAFDQSLANCGWVHLHTTAPGAPPSVVDHGVLKSRPDLNLRSNLDMLTAHDELVVRLVNLVHDLNISRSFLDRMEWLHETPPNMGKVAGSGASSLLAAAAVRTAAAHFGKTVTAIGAQTVKKAVTGSAKSEKPQVRAAIDALPIDGKRPGNEHTREALGIALTHLART